MDRAAAEGSLRHLVSTDPNLLRVDQREVGRLDWKQEKEMADQGD